MPQLDPQYYPSQIFWLAVTFIVFYLLLSRLILPRISAVMEERAERIADDLDKADQVRRETEGVIEAYERALAEARAGAAAAMAKTAQELAEISATRQAAFQAELDGKLEAAEARIAAARDEARAHVRDIARTAATGIVAKLSPQPVDDLGGFRADEVGNIFRDPCGHPAAPMPDGDGIPIGHGRVGGDGLQHLQPRRVDPIVIGYQNPHVIPSFRPALLSLMPAGRQ